MFSSASHVGTSTEPTTQDGKINNSRLFTSGFISLATAVHPTLAYRDQCEEYVYSDEGPRTTTKRKRNRGTVMVNNPTLPTFKEGTDCSYEHNSLQRRCRREETPKDERRATSERGGEETKGEEGRVESRRTDRRVAAGLTSAFQSSQYEDAR